MAKGAITLAQEANKEECQACKRKQAVDVMAFHHSAPT